MSGRRTTRPVGRWGTVSPPPVEPVAGQLELVEVPEQPATPSRGRSS